MTFVARTKFRLVQLALLGALPLGHAQAANITVQVSASASKPLTFASRQDLDFGQILTSGDGGTVSISMTGVRTCAAGLTCSGATQHAIFNVSGTNGWVVRIITAPSDLVNQTNGSTLRFTPVAPASVTLTNSGAPGKNFGVGGAITVTPSTSDGLYVGNVEVTVDYP